MLHWSEILELQTAAEALTIANRSCHAQPTLDVRQNEFHLHDLSASQLRRDVDCHAVFAQVMAASLQNTLTLLHDGKHFDREVHLEALGAANRMRNVC